MPRYIDGFLLPLPVKNLKSYRAMATKASKVFRDHGALEYLECVGEDLTPAFGVPFPRQLKCKKGETVVLAWIVYKSRAQRDKVNALVMKDPRMNAMMGNKKMPLQPRPHVVRWLQRHRLRLILRTSALCTPPEPSMSTPALPTCTASKKATITGWILGVLPCALLLFSASMKLINPPGMDKGFEQLGWPISLALALGILELSCTILYLIPRTAILGGILLAGYMGGAIATHVRIHEEIGRAHV